METPTPYPLGAPEGVQTRTIEPNGIHPRKRAELWRQFTAHLLGLATVLWWIWFKEAPPK